MIKPFYEEEFDVKKYVSERILEIDSLSERVLYREITENMIIKLFEKHRQEYSNLVKRVLNEVDQSNITYDISIGLIEKNKYDGTDTFLHPIISNNDTKITIEDIKTSINNNELYLLGNFYFKDFYYVIKEFIKHENTFDGFINTTKGKYKTKFKIILDERYLNKIKQLYEIFQINSIRWETICIAHLMRIFLIYIEEFVDVDIDYINGEFIDYDIDFREYTNKIIKEVIPLWNLSAFEEKTSAFPIPVNGKLKYEHTILSNRLKSNNKILICNNDVEIYYILRNNQNLLITCNNNSPRKWDLFELHSNIENRNYNYAVLDNTSKTNLTTNLRKKYESKIYTKAEIQRFIQETPYADKILHCDVEVKDIYEDMYESYSMNDFIYDEIENNNNNKILLLSFFVNDINDYLIYDYISFITTKIQYNLPQYKCFGKVVR